MNDSGQTFENLKKDLSAYLELKLSLLKLNTYERTSKVISILSYGLIVLFLAFFAILFVFIALGFFLGNLLDSNAAGFGCVSLLSLLILGILLRNKERIKLCILNAVIAALIENDEKQNKENDESSPTDPDRETAC